MLLHADIQIQMGTAGVLPFGKNKCQTHEQQKITNNMFNFKEIPSLTGFKDNQLKGGSNPMAMGEPVTVDTLSHHAEMKSAIQK